ncbi:MAG: iron-sulfur cluster assembly accessory protein [Cyanobacteria bacterium J06581_3]
MTVTLTELAELRLRTFVQGTPNPTPTRGIRLAVKDGGCNGYEYDIKVANAPRSDDEVTELGNLKVFVDPKSAPLLDGVVVDYIDSLLESGFKFTNPNAADTCGCGKSFQTTDDCSPAGVACS